MAFEVNSTPKGCDTFIIYPPTTPEGLVIFGKNSDRPFGEKQSIRKYPAASYNPGSHLRCTYISIPQVAETYAIIISQIDWMWGCENGANEHGVVIGNEAVWTKVPEEKEHSLLGMDLVRLGLERGKTSRQSLKIITELLELHGQGGPCAENDPSFTYHNSFLIADFDEAWILETAGRHWVAQRWTTGSRNISNELTIRTGYDLQSEDIQQYAKENHLWNGEGRLDFAAAFGLNDTESLSSCESRQACGESMLSKFAFSKKFTSQDMFAILCDHESGICMHGAFETTASMVSELNTTDRKGKHWMTGKPNPCISSFQLQSLDDSF